MSVGSPVFANGMEISSKSMGGKSICEFPDVCFTPPLTPATPPGVPIPYPNTGQAGDTSDGSTSVSIGSQEVMLKDRSAFKTSCGDEAGSAPKKGIITSKIKGRVYFVAWSMDVKIEGENVVRNLDMTTHNHACSPANGSVPTVHVAQTAMGKFTNCEADSSRATGACGDSAEQCPGLLAQSVDVQRSKYKRSKGLSRTAQAGSQATADANGSKCVKAMRCFLRPYKPTRKKAGCCPGQTPHHIPPQSMMKGVKGYSKNEALCVCLEGASQHVGSHGENHAALDHIASKPGVLNEKGQCSVAKYNEVCAQAVAAQCGCDPKCIEDQLNDSFTPSQREAKVTHYQSSSKQLSPAVKRKINETFDAAKKRVKG
jgi:hypothetical protein